MMYFCFEIQRYFVMCLLLKYCCLEGTFPICNNQVAEHRLNKKSIVHDRYTLQLANDTIK